MNTLTYVENAQTSEFYPTPCELAKKMLEDVDWRYIRTILEPSAGKGDILREIARVEKNLYNSLDVDCIELDPNLRQILKYNFSAEREQKMRDQLQGPDRRTKYDRGTELETFFRDGIHVIHDDFLTFNSYKRYDLIVMNPPFSTGDKHLLKALEVQRYGGSIVCILNAETIKNPWSATRKELKRQLAKYGAKIQYVNGAFSHAERQTDVEIAIVRVHIDAPHEDSSIWDKLVQAEKYEDFSVEDVTDLEVSDYIKAAIARFNMEVKAGLEIIRQYRALQPYITSRFEENAPGILKLSMRAGRHHDDVTVNSYITGIRFKYWKALLANPKFIGKLTSKLQDEYRTQIDRLKDYDFTEFNIQTLVAEMNAKVKSGIEDEIEVMFDRLTAEHTWYPECSKNRHYYNGWKTNAAHKIGKKVIIPTSGIFSSWSGLPDAYRARDVLEDIEKILNYFDGHMTREVDLWRQLQTHFAAGITQKIECRFFDATFYKKGTVHLTFTCPDLIERFNIHAAQHRGWLPPSYGKKSYTEMDTEEKTVVDSFQGEAAYNKVLTRAAYFLAPVVGSNVMLLEG